MPPSPCERGLFDMPRDVRFSARPPKRIEESLASAGLHAGLRGDRIRITPHLYNDDEEDVERLVAALIG